MTLTVKQILTPFTSLGNMPPGRPTAALTMQVTPAPGQVGGSDPTPAGQVQDYGRERTVGGVVRTKPPIGRKVEVDGSRPKLAGRPVVSKKPNVTGPYRFNASRAVPGVRRVGPGPFKKLPVGAKKKGPAILKKNKQAAPTISSRATTLSELETTSAPVVSRESHPAAGAGPTGEEVPAEDGAPTTPQPTAKRTPFHRPLFHGGRFQNRTRPNLRPPQHPRSGPVRKTYPAGKTSGGSSITAGSQTIQSEKDTTPKVPDSQSGERDAPASKEGVQTGQPGEPDHAEVVPPTGVRVVSVEASSPESQDSENLSLTDGSDSDKDTPGSPEEPATEAGAKDQPPAGHGNKTTAPEPAVTLQSQDKKCMNKIKVTHFRFPHKVKSSGCRGDGPALARKTAGTHPGSPPTDDFSSSEEADLDYSPDPLHKLLVDTYDQMNISTFSVHLSKQQNASHDSVGMKTSDDLKLPSVSTSSSSPSPSSSSSSLSQVSSTAAPSSSSPADPVPPSPPSPHRPDELSSAGREELLVEESKAAADVPTPEARKNTLSGKGTEPLFRRTPAKSGFFRRPRPNIQVRPPHRSPPESKQASTSELLPPSSSSEQSSSVEGIVTVDRTSGANTFPSTETEQSKTPERRPIPGRRPPPKGGFLRRPLPNIGHLQNRTRPNVKLLPPSHKPSSAASETSEESPSELQTASSDPAPRDSRPAEGTEEDDSRDSVGTSSSTEFNKNVRGVEAPASNVPTTKFSRPLLISGRFPNRTRLNLRPPQHPLRGVQRKPLPSRKLNSGDAVPAASRTSPSEKHITPQNQVNQSEENDALTAIQRVPAGTPEEREAEQTQGSTIRPQTNTGTKNKATEAWKDKTEPQGSAAGAGVREVSVNPGEKPGAPSQAGPGPVSADKPRRPFTFQKRPPPTRGAHVRPFTRDDRKTNATAQRLLDGKTERPGAAGSKPLMGSGDSSSALSREPLDSVAVTNKTSDGFMLSWDSPEGKYKNFVVTRKAAGKDETLKQKEKSLFGGKEDESDGARTQHPTEQVKTENGGSDAENRVPENPPTHVSSTRSQTSDPAAGSDEAFRQVLPGSSRSFQFQDLPPQTEYTVTLLGKGPGLLSRLHKLVISTGPEPPTNIIFSKVTENSVTVSWTKPKSSIDGFKVTYIHTEDGEPVSVSLDSDKSTVALTQLSPGSLYEVNVISILGLDESDPIKDLVRTLPDPPTDLRAVNITDTKALLLWRPALATVDKYAIVYGSGTGSELRVTVSGNAAEQQLSGLEASTTYTVTISSQLGDQDSAAATTTFTTSRGSGEEQDGPRDLQAENVTPRSALLSWKPPSNPVGRYRLTCETEGQELKEVVVDASVSEYRLTRLHPGSKYVAQLRTEGGSGSGAAAITAEFTTGTLRFPFPTDCSQELLNGGGTSGEFEVFPQGTPGSSLMVYCDMETDGGGWTVFQRRKDGSVDFFRGWKDYVRGFGDLSGEFWLGLDLLHNLTSATRMILRVDLRDKDESAFAKYSTFDVAKRNYKLSVGGYSGTAGDSLSYHNNRVFSTKDRDPAPFITRCAMSYRGGWWYKNCHEANLNGLYGIDVKHQGVIWTTWKGKEYSIDFTEMKMRPAAFRPPTRA
ncbi:uncharacterized protein V6R79_001847 [Siganus canaliculatus]